MGRNQILISAVAYALQAASASPILSTRDDFVPPGFGVSLQHLDVDPLPKDFIYSSLGNLVHAAQGDWDSSSFGPGTIGRGGFIQESVLPGKERQFTTKVHSLGHIACAKAIVGGNFQADTFPASNCSVAASEDNIVGVIEYRNWTGIPFPGRFGSPSPQDQPGSCSSKWMETETDTSGTARPQDVDNPLTSRAISPTNKQDSSTCTILQSNQTMLGTTLTPARVELINGGLKEPANLIPVALLTLDSILELVKELRPGTGEHPASFRPGWTFEHADPTYGYRLKLEADSEVQPWYASWVPHMVQSVVESGAIGACEFKTKLNVLVPTGETEQTPIGRAIILRPNGTVPLFSGSIERL